MSNSDYSTHPKYRPDIDGLRAIAVLSVVGFHAFPSFIKGGFIGVDVFFVISGFLISSIIIDNLNSATFSFGEFYIRRVKRIFPALLLVLVFSFLLGWFTLFQGEYKQLGKHIAGGVGFISNFLLWNESGYFDSTETKPLLHLWSLGIEEQFYVVWPILLWFAWKQRLNLLSITIVVGITSFALNIYETRNSAQLVAAFYSPQTRFWELMAGAILSYMTLFSNKFYIFNRSLELWFGRLTSAPKEHITRLCNIGSLLGAILILSGILFVSKGSSFPGWWALLPVIGTVLIILAGSQAWLNRVILSNRALVWFGLISFPLYLWHWPLLSFARILEGETPPRALRVAAILISIALAWLTFRFIETPIRLRDKDKPFELKNEISADKKPLALCVLMLIIGLAGFIVYKQDGFSYRQDHIQSDLSDIDWDRYFLLLSKETSECLPVHIREKSHKFSDGTIRCRQTISDDPLPTIVIIGDSHAEHLFWGAANRIKHNQNLIYFTYSCLPFLGLKRLEMADCDNMQEALEYVINQPSVHTVILSSYWMDRSNQPDIRPLHALTDPDNDASFKDGLRITLQALTAAGKSVVFAYDVPSLGFDPLRCVRPFPLFVSRGKCSVSKNQVDIDENSYRGLVEEVLADFPKVKRWNPSDMLCRDGECPVVRDGKLLYKDIHNHITMFASEYISGSLIDVIFSENGEVPKY